MNDTMLLFDLDGTLWDSGTQVCESWNKVLEETLPSKQRFSLDEIHGIMGKSMDEIELILFSDVDESLRKEVFSRCIVTENEYLEKNGAVLFDSVTETLSSLKLQGFDMAVVSNCQTGYIPAFLSSMKMSEFFMDYEEWGRTQMPKSENIKLVMERNGYSKGIYIGDTQKDEDSAHCAGIPFIHAAYGFGTSTVHEGSIEHFSQLPGVIENILSVYFR